MKRFNNNSDICHYWANSNENENGKASNIFFEKNTIYSYGHHFKLAEKVYKNNELQFILFNKNSYSKSTAKHQNHLRRAIGHLKVVYVNTGLTGYYSEFNPLIEVKNDILNIKNHLTDYKNAKKYKLAPLRDINSTLNKIEFLTSYYRIKSKLKKSEKEYLNQVKDILDQLFIDAENYENIWKEKEAIKLQQKREKQEKANKDALIEWRSFERQSLPYWSDKVYLRINKEQKYVQTSKNVKIDFNEAQRLIKLIEAKKLIGSKVNNQFTVTAFNGVLTAGCHTIESTEVFNTINQLKSIS